MAGVHSVGGSPGIGEAHRSPKVEAFTTTPTQVLEARAQRLQARLKDASTGDANFPRAAELKVELEDAQRELTHRRALAASRLPELALSLHQSSTAELMEAQRRPGAGWSAAERERQRLVDQELAHRSKAQRGARIELALNVLSSGSPNLRAIKNDRENPEAFISAEAMAKRTDAALVALRSTLVGHREDALTGADREPARAEWARQGLANLDAEERLRAAFAQSAAPAFALHVHQLPTKDVHELIDMLARLTLKTWNGASVATQLELARAELARR